MTRKRQRPPTAPPPAPNRVEALARAVAAAAPAYLPGEKAFWRNPDDGIWHPVSVRFACCEASGPEPLWNVVDEFGWGHLVYANSLRPRDIGADYQERPPGPRKGETP